MFDLQALLRPNIRGLTPYSSARDDFAGQAEVWLDANENALGSPSVEGDFHRYPDPHQGELRAALAAYRRLAPEQVFTGHGSDEAIDLLLRACCQPGHDRLLSITPSYGMYGVSAQIHDLTIDRVPLEPDFSLDPEKLLAAVRPQTKLLFLCSPNNPTGNCFEPAAIETILDRFQGLVVLDEAYIDFAVGRSWVSRLGQYPNLVILQTFSKAWGLAAQRIGMAYATPELIQVLDRIKPPYNLSGPAQATALAALRNARATEEAARLLMIQREALKDVLERTPGVEHVHPSEANFLLVRFTDAKQTFNELKAAGVIVRDRSALPGCAGCLRITVGTETENARLVEILRKLA